MSLHPRLWFRSVLAASLALSLAACGAGVPTPQNEAPTGRVTDAEVTSQGLLDFLVGPTTTDARDDATATETGRTILILVLGNDRGRNLSVAALGRAANGTVTLDGARVQYRPNDGFTGTDTFTYTAAGERGQDTATVTVNVLPRNPEAPTANDDTAQTAANTPVGIAVLANDTDPDRDPLTVLSASQPANGTAEVVFNGFTGRSEAVKYTPNPGFTGTDTFTYQMSDSDGFNEGDGGDTATVTVTVR
ncbi:hypothetical protein DAETH_34030 (plasmid) [Deinococcus aetherius]|uniref:Tandem-95 repeat protein n=1 Tax=Deinococcus aetherius TaxID=200252 RepID=A0ABN6RL12_9DEIO|nr:cadherin-like domain-containing protein [Deinococcus aetherius]BDP43434.1 hypothetical protein DAETH_34030 [Deinococcus aetherius]